MDLAKSPNTRRRYKFHCIFMYKQLVFRKQHLKVKCVGVTLMKVVQDFHRKLQKVPERLRKIQINGKIHSVNGLEEETVVRC